MNGSPLQKKNYLLSFLWAPSVPPTHLRSERGARGQSTVKKKKKNTPSAWGFSLSINQAWHKTDAARRMWTGGTRAVDFSGKTNEIMRECIERLGASRVQSGWCDRVLWQVKCLIWLFMIWCIHIQRQERRFLICHMGVMLFHKLKGPETLRNNIVNVSWTMCNILNRE